MQAEWRLKRNRQRHKQLLKKLKNIIFYNIFIDNFVLFLFTSFFPFFCKFSFFFIHPSRIVAGTISAALIVMVQHLFASFSFGSFLSLKARDDRDYRSS